MSEKKDIWDKLGGLTPLLATTLLGLLGLYFTNSYENANAKLRELEAVQKLLPHLSGKDAGREEQKLALVALRELGSPQIAIQFAEILGTDGARDALRFTASTSTSPEEVEKAKAALARLTVTTGSGGSESPAEFEDVLQKLRDLHQLDDFLILAREEQIYMQTTGGPDAFHVEYRDGSEDQHFFCTMNRGEVEAAFSLYAANDQTWRKLCAWEPLF